MTKLMLFSLLLTSNIALHPMLSKTEKFDNEKSATQQTNTKKQTHLTTRPTRIQPTNYKTVYIVSNGKKICIYSNNNNNSKL